MTSLTNPLTPAAPAPATAPVGAPPETPAGTTVRANPLTAGGWSGLSFIAANIIGGVIYYPLARILTPEHFGLYGQANLVFLAATLLSEGVIIQTMVQMPGDRERLARAAVWLSAVFGLLGALLCVVAAPFMVRFYREPELLPLLLLLAPGVLAAAFGAAPHALLSRELDFRRKTLPETSAMLLGGLAALAAALAGLGVYSLVAHALTMSLVSAVVAWWICRRAIGTLSARPDWETLRRMVRFVRSLVLADLALYVRLNTDYALTGRVLGTQALGIYTIAWATSVGPQLFINAFTGRVGYALFAKLQDDRGRLQEVFISGLRLIASAALPVSAGAIVLAPEIVRLTVGRQWEAAIGPVMVLFALQCVRTICGPGASIILATGHSRLYAIIGGLAAPLTIIAVLVGTRGGVIGVAWAMFVAVGGASLTYLYFAVRLLRLSPRQVLRALGPAVSLTAASLPAIILTEALLSGPVQVSAGLRPGIALVMGCVAAFATIRRLWPVFRHDLERLRTALPEETHAHAG